MLSLLPLYRQVSITSNYNLVADGLQVIVHPHPVADKATDLLIAHHVPHPVTGQHEELITALVSLLDIKFWFRRHQLLRWSLPVHILVLKISKSPRHSQR